MEKILTEQSIELIAGLITVVLTILSILSKVQLDKIKKKFDHDESDHDAIGVSLWCDRAVMDIIAESRVLNVATRSYVIRFHNGSYFTGRQPIWKMSCSHESVATGERYATTEDIQNIPASSLLDLVVPFWGSIVKGTKRLDIPNPETGGSTDPRNGVYYTSVATLDPSMAKQVLTNQGVSYMVSVPLVDPDDGRVLGLFGLDYGVEHSEQEPFQSPMELKATADRISYILTRSTSREPEEKKKK